VALAWGLWALVMLGLAVAAWLDYLLRQAGRPELVTMDIGVFTVLGEVIAATVGALLASRRPRHPVGWLLLALGLSLTMDGVSLGYANYGLLARPGALPAADYAAAYTNGFGFAEAALLGFVLLLTPTGSLPSRRWRWWARVAAAAPAVGLVTAVPLPFDGVPLGAVPNPLAVASLAGQLQVASGVSLAVTVLAIPVGAWSLVVRYRRARGTERQQLRWLALGAAVVAVAVAAMVVLVFLGNFAAVPWVFDLCVVPTLPLATGAAILRYRLYDLDRIVSRTVAYGLLTVLLGGGYAGVVLGLGQLLGRRSSLVVAPATLAAAALFQPARRRIQATVDRRFNRRRYDAARTIAAFTARLREQVDLDTLSAELLAVVDQTMEPASASLWLRPPPDRAPAVEHRTVSTGVASRAGHRRPSVHEQPVDAGRLVAG
jgi:hypothetical protein